MAYSTVLYNVTVMHLCSTLRWKENATLNSGLQTQLTWRSSSWLCNIYICLCVQLYAMGYSPTIRYQLPKRDITIWESWPKECWTPVVVYVYVYLESSALSSCNLISTLWRHPFLCRFCRAALLGYQAAVVLHSLVILQPQMEKHQSRSLTTIITQKTVIP